MLISSSALKNTAVADCGLEDFGGSAFEEPLDVLVDAINASDEFSDTGRAVIQDFLLRHLSNRLRIQGCLGQNPEIREEKIVRPLFVVGPARSGTTMLHRLLALHPKARSLRTYEVFYPWPERAISGSAAKLRAALCRQAIRPYVAELGAQHTVDVEGPEECQFLMMNSFACYHFASLMHAPAYLDWMSAADMLEPYREYADQLRLLQWQQRGSHMVLKTPNHLPHIETILEVFPDARFVVTLRNPLETLPSYLRLIHSFRKMFCDDPDLERIGLEAIERTVVYQQSIQWLRGNVPSEQRFELAYERLVDDPIRSVEELYRHLDYDVPEDLAQRIGGWMAKHGKRDHGQSLELLARYGLSPDAVEAAVH
jgi:hypothetical protein